MALTTERPPTKLSEIAYDPLQRVSTIRKVHTSRLQQIADVLEVAPDFFFAEVHAKKAGNSGSNETTLIDEFISSRDGIALSRAFGMISNVKIRRSIVLLVEQIAQV